MTRLEIADVVRDVFDGGAVGRGELIATASERRARPEVVRALRQLPERTYSELRALWEHLREVPVGE